MKIIFIFILSLVSVMFARGQKHWESLIIETDSFKYFDAATEPPGEWMQLEFDDSSWDSGIGGFGYNDGDDNTIIPNSTASIYLRKVVNIPSDVSVNQLILDIDFDDAFVAYINGTEVARSQNLQPGTPARVGSVTSDHEAQLYAGGLPERIILEPSVLNEGDNILAVHVMNISTSSSDFSARIFLSAELNADHVLFHTLPDWFQEPVSYVSSNLPIIKINTQGGTIVDEPKIMAKMQVINNAEGINRFDDTEYEYDGYIGIEIRGNTAQMFEKKSYTVETRLSTGENNNVKLLGMPEENDWVFHGPYSDKSLMRNALAYFIGKSMDNGWHPRTRFVELEINNEYRGVYLVAEKIKIDKNRVDIATLQPTDIEGNELTGGYIISIDRDQPGSWNSPFMGRTGSVDVPFSYVDPKYDELTTEQRNYIRNYITDFEYALHGNNYQNPELGYKAYIDIVSFIDYFIITELSKDLDGYRVSVFFHKDKDSKDGRLKMTPYWDYNICFGNANFFSAGNPEGWASDGIGAGDWYEIPFWWDKFRTDPYFESLLRYRWTELRKDIINTTTINQFIDSVSDMLRMAQERNFEKFKILNTYVWPNNYIGGTYELEVEYLKNWINQRITWLDQQMAKIMPSNFSLSEIETLTASDITLSSSTIGGNVSSDGGSYIWERGFYWSEVDDPEDDGEKVKSGKGSGNFAVTLTGLEPYTKYYYRAYAKNDIGTSYGELQSFITDDVNSATSLIKHSEKDIVAYPNPFSDNFTISMKLDRSSLVEIRVMNIMGEVVESYSRDCYAGKNQLNVNANTFASNGNIYFYQVFIEGMPAGRGKILRK
ncbi:MAG: CotH kinase family protein [Bacteroidales bacterium]|nr:CotH kinase family protein [Bacteroidales bacterium]